MRKAIFTLVVLFACLSGAYAQTLVTTDPTNKNIILEEFTGIHCVYCPEGHAIAQAILDNNPGRAVAIAIHQGSFAVPDAGDPDYRTPFGDALASQAGVNSYPAGTVNRHLFLGGKTGMGRGDWTPSGNIILDQPSPVNVGIESSYNSTTRELTVHVELYYTANSATTSNFINIALLQDHIFGPQTGGGAGNNYEHMHMLRYLITGQWGDEVTTTTQGSFVDRTYTYVIPDAYTSIPCVVENCQVAVFVAQSHQEVLSGDVVDAIGGTNLYIGDIRTSDSLFQLGHPSMPTSFSLTANSNIAGTEPFVIRLVNDAPDDWTASFTIDGISYTDSTVVDLTKGTSKDLNLEVTPGDSASFATYIFELVSVNNPNAPTKYFRVYVISKVQTLLVNASGDQNAASFQDVYINGLTAAGCDNLGVTSSANFKKAATSKVLTEVLNIFYNVAWTFPAFTDPEASAVMEFINNGGKFLTAGQDIGWDLMSGASGSHGSPITEDLYTNYLKANYVADGTSSNNKLVAEPTDPIYGTVPAGNVIDVNGGNMYPDQITPRDNATAIFYYNTAKSKIGAVKSTRDEAKVVYFGIGLEMIQSTDIRNEVIKKTYDWFMEGVGINEQAENRFTLGQNLPNPASGSTVIQFTLQQPDHVSLKLYDLHGRAVWEILDSQVPAGNRKVTVNTSELSPGVYYYTLKTSTGKQTRKMVVVK
jgi:hypothetical protein